jgi:hypothetical protein
MIVIAAAFSLPVVSFFSYFAGLSRGSFAMKENRFLVEKPIVERVFNGSATVFATIATQEDKNRIISKLRECFGGTNIEQRSMYIFVK